MSTPNSPIEFRMHTELYVPNGHWGEFLGDIKMHRLCYQKDRTRSRSVSVHSYLTYDASRAHRRGRGDKTKKSHFFACHHEANSALRTISILHKLCWGV